MKDMPMFLKVTNSCTNEKIFINVNTIVSIEDNVRNYKPENAKTIIYTVSEKLYMINESMEEIENYLLC